MREEMKLGRRGRGVTSSNGDKGKRGKKRSRNGSVANEAIWEEENEGGSPDKWGRNGRGTAKSRRNRNGSKGGRRKKSKSKNSGLPPRKWRDTRKVSYLGARPASKDGSREKTLDQFDPRNSSKGGELYKLKRGDDYLKNLMNRYGPDLKKKEKAKKKKRAASRGIPGGGRQVSYFDQPEASRRKRRPSAASSNLSEDPDGTWSNTRMLRYFVKEAVKERQGTENELEVGILNRSLSQASIRIFNDIREKEHQNNNNSPMRILDGKRSSTGINRASRESTTSAKNRHHHQHNLIYEQDDRSVGNKDRELSNILRES